MTLTVLYLQSKITKPYMCTKWRQAGIYITILSHIMESTKILKIFPLWVAFWFKEESQTMFPNLLRTMCKQKRKKSKIKHYRLMQIYIALPEYLDQPVLGVLTWNSWNSTTSLKLDFMSFLRGWVCTLLLYWFRILFSYLKLFVHYIVTLRWG